MRPDGPALAFEPHRPRLTGLAYRMLGSLAEAEDAVQDAYLRWHQVDHARVRDGGAFLYRLITRLCLDRLKSARARREAYVGPWLPEPVLDAPAFAAPAESEWAADLSFALLLALQRLSPLERAAFLLHDMFDVEFCEVGAALGRSEAACRQLAARARAHVRDARPRFPVSDAEGKAILAAFLRAAHHGDAAALRHLLAEDARLHTDGGGIKLAPLNVIVGRERIARFFAGLARKGAIPPRLVGTVPVNGLPGALIEDAEGSLHVVALELRSGRIGAIYVVGNPEKLRHLQPPPVRPLHPP